MPRPVELIFGPTGLTKVTFEGDVAICTCRNSLEDKISTFETTISIGSKLNHWLAGTSGKSLQDIVPELSPELREMCLSGLTPEEWEDTFKGREDDADLGEEDTPSL